MLKISILLVVIFIASMILVFTALAVIKWRTQQELIKRKAIDQLVRRSYRLISILEVVSDRYLPIQIKLLLIDYLISIIPNLMSKSSEVNELARKLAELVELKSQLNSGFQETKGEKISSLAYLSKVQSALKSLPPLLKEFAEKRLIDKATAKHQVELVRYTYCLAHYDVLIYKADADLAANKKASALEKYRTALAEMEKVAIIEEASADIERVKLRIVMVEDILFVNRVPA